VRAISREALERDGGAPALEHAEQDIEGLELKLALLGLRR
jgi:hypothetical protein